jgi:hypothetical protein
MASPFICPTVGVMDEDENPLFLEMLSAEDREEFEVLRKRLGSRENRYNRNKRLVTLQESLDSIKAFCIRGRDDDSFRCLACGICWLDDGEIAINVRQLRVILAKSKSTINGALAKLKFITVPTKDDDAARLYRAIPYLKGHYLEMRQWTIRKKHSLCQSPRPDLVDFETIPVDSENEPALPLDDQSHPEDLMVSNDFTPIDDFEMNWDDWEQERAFDYGCEDMVTPPWGFEPETKAEGRKPSREFQAWTKFSLAF